MKTKVILIILLVFVAAPLSAKLVSTFVLNRPRSPQLSNINTLTKQEAYNAITERNKSNPISNQYNPEFTVEEIKKLSQWWYVAIIEMDGQDQSVLLSKFTNDSVIAKTNPGVGLPYLNISDGAGVPYDAIDKLNETLDDHGHDQE